MILEVDLQVKGVEAMTRREVNAILKEAYYLTGKRWRQLYLPLHFGPRAYRRYNYSPRAGQRIGGDHKPGSYAARKKRFVGHSRPLEFSGEGKRMALTQEKISATSKKVVVRLPRKFNLRAKGSKVRMADEIREVRRDEIASLTQFMVDYIRKTLRQSGATGATVRGRVRSL